MEKHHISRLLGKVEEPTIATLKDYIGAEVLLGIEGKDQFGNAVTKYISGFIGRRDDGSIDLCEYITQEGKEVANMIMLIDINSPIVEAIVPLRVEMKENRNYASGKPKTDLIFRVSGAPSNPNLGVSSTYHFQSKR